MSMTPSIVAEFFLHLGDGFFELLEVFARHLKIDGIACAGGE